MGLSRGNVFARCIVAFSAGVDRFQHTVVYFLTNCPGALLTVQGQAVFSKDRSSGKPEGIGVAIGILESFEASRRIEPLYTDLQS
jgi:hypothetical protein